MKLEPQNHSSYETREAFERALARRDQAMRCYEPVRARELEVDSTFRAHGGYLVAPHVVTRFLHWAKVAHGGSGRPKGPERAAAYNTALRKLEADNGGRLPRVQLLADAELRTYVWASRTDFKPHCQLAPAAVRISRALAKSQAVIFHRGLVREWKSDAAIDFALVGDSKRVYRIKIPAGAWLGVSLGISPGRICWDGDLTVIDGAAGSLRSLEVIAGTDWERREEPEQLAATARMLDEDLRDLAGRPFLPEDGGDLQLFRRLTAAYRDACRPPVRWRCSLAAAVAFARARAIRRGGPHSEFGDFFFAITSYYWRTTPCDRSAGRMLGGVLANLLASGEPRGIANHGSGSIQRSHASAASAPPVDRGRPSYTDPGRGARPRADDNDQEEDEEVA